MATTQVQADVVYDGKPATIVISPEAVVLKRADAKAIRTFPIADVAGATVAVHAGTKGMEHRVRIVSSAQATCCTGGNVIRRKLAYTQVVCENDQKAGDVVRWIRCAVRKLPFDAVPTQLRLLVLVNPYGGGKKAPSMYQELVEPVLTAAGLHVTQLITRSADDARNIMAGTADLGVDVLQYQGLVCVSGDGMIYECLQGIMKRPEPERRRLLRLPVGHIPGGTLRGLRSRCGSRLGLTVLSGTSNALAASMGARDPITAALLIARCETRPMDLLRVRSDDGREYFAFLMVSWALPSDVNFEAELNRWMGAGRKDFVIVKKILQMPSYRGRLTLDVVKGAPRVPCVPGCALCQHGAADPMLQSSAEQTAATEAAEQLQIEDDIFFFDAISLPDIAYNIRMAPFAHASDGLLDVILFRRASCSRLGLLKLFGQVKDGSHVAHPAVEYYRCRRLRLDPLGGSHLNLDGETLDYLGPVTVDVMQAAWTVFGPAIAPRGAAPPAPGDAAVAAAAEAAAAAAPAPLPPSPAVVAPAVSEPAAPAAVATAAPAAAESAPAAAAVVAAEAAVRHGSTTAAAAPASSDTATAAAAPTAVAEGGAAVAAAPAAAGADVAASPAATQV